MGSVALATYVASAVTVIGAVLVLVFHTGRLSVRVERLEEDRLGFERKFDAVHATLRRLEALIRGEAP